MKEQLHSLLATAVSQLQQDGVIGADTNINIQLDRTKSQEHGDLATNLALTLAKQAGMAPRALAEKILAALPANTLIRQADIAGPGFINFFLNEAAATAVIQTILEQGEHFGRNNLGQGKKVQVEFVSANPTGPLHVGHGRGAAVGDSLCRLLKASGWDVTAEFYYNDAGQQINNLTLSTQARCKGLGPDDASWPEDGYRGDYIIDVANAYNNKESVRSADMHVTGTGDAEDMNAIRHFAVAYLRHEQDLDLKAFGVDFNVYFLESSLYENVLFIFWA